MCQKPVCDKNHHSESTELPDGTTTKASDDTQYGVVGTTLESVGCPSPTQALCDTDLDREGDRSGIYGMDL